MTRSLLILFSLMLAGNAGAATVLDFNDFEHLEWISDFYDGGFNQAGVQGPDYDVRISGGLAYDWQGETLMTFESAFTSPAFVFADTPFTTGLAFRTTSLATADFTLFITVRDVNQVTLIQESVVVPAWVPGTPPEWLQIGFAFEGMAHTVIFSDDIGIATVIGIDDLTLGRTTLVPLPAAFWLFLGALSGASLLTRRRRSRS